MGAEEVVLDPLVRVARSNLFPVLIGRVLDGRRFVGQAFEFPFHLLPF